MADVYCIVNQTIRLSEPTREIHLTTPLAYSNSQAHAMQVTVVNDTGGPADLSNVGVTGHFRKANGDTVTPINGTVSGNVARVILPASCYVTPGRFTFTMDLSVTGDYNRTALWVEGMVKRNTSSNIIDPGTPVSNIEQAISRANAAAQAAEEAADQVGYVRSGIAPSYGEIDFPISEGMQHCWVDGTLYVNTVDINTAETWTPAHWQAVDVSGELADLKYEIDQGGGSGGLGLNAIVREYSSDRDWSRGELCLHDGQLYICTTSLYTWNTGSVGEFDPTKWEAVPKLSDILLFKKEQYLGSEGAETVRYNIGAARVEYDVGDAGSRWIDVYNVPISETNTAIEEPGDPDNPGPEEPVPEEPATEEP